MRNARSLTACGLALVLGVAHTQVRAGTPSPPLVSIETEIVQMNLQSASPTPVPLASDPGNALGDSIEGYGFVDSTVVITESSTLQSGVTMSIGFDPLTSIAAITANLSLHLDLGFTDVDAVPARDYVGQPDGATLNLLANSGSPMLVTQTASIDFTAAFALLFGTTTPTEQELLDALTAGTTLDPIVSTAAEYALGVDVNGNAENDKVKLKAADIAFDPMDLMLDITGTSGGLEGLIESILAGTLSGPLTFGASVSISAANFTFDGLVVDESTDPPFTLDVSTDDPVIGIDPNAVNVPAPGPALLLLAGLLVTGAAVRRRL
jgi:hypothetical protein